MLYTFMSVDSVTQVLEEAEVCVARNDITAAAEKLTKAVQQLTDAGLEILRAISATEFDSPVFQIVKRIAALFPTDTIQQFEESGQDTRFLPESAEPHDVLTSVRILFEEETEKTGDADTGSSMSRIEFLISLLTGQQTMRDAIFSSGGLYQSAAAGVSPYLIGFLSYTGNAFEEAEKKADAMLSGPARRLAELFYSLLTSSFTAGLLLLVIRRLIPIRRPSKASTAVNAAVLTATNIPILIAGLRAVAKELETLRDISARR